MRQNTRDAYASPRRSRSILSRSIRIDDDDCRLSCGSSLNAHASRKNTSVARAFWRLIRMHTPIDVVSTLSLSLFLYRRPDCLYARKRSVAILILMYRAILVVVVDVYILPVSHDIPKIWVAWWIGYMSDAESLYVCVCVYTSGLLENWWESCDAIYYIESRRVTRE